MPTLGRLTFVTALLSLAIVAGAATHVGADDRPETAQEGKLAPELALSNWQNSKALKLSELSGKVVLIEFWATWCTTCKAGLAKVKKLAEDYKGKDLVIIGVHDKKDNEKMAAFVERQKIPYACAADDTGATAKKYGVKTLPAFVLIDKKGIVTKIDGEPPIEALEKLVAAK